MTTHKNGIGLILMAQPLTSGTTRCEFLYQVVRDLTNDTPGNDKSWNWYDPSAGEDYINLAYDDSVGGNRKKLVHDFTTSQTESVIQDYIVNTLGFNALPEGTLMKCKTKSNANHTVFGVPEPGTVGNWTEYLELVGDVNPVTIPTSGTTKFWTPTDAGGAYCLYWMLWDYRPLIDTFAGKAEDAGWRIRWDDVDDQLEISWDGVNWYPYTDPGSTPTLQDALNALASSYPTEDYDAAIDSNNIIYVRPGSGGAGTITFSSEYQTVLDEENGTFVLNTGRRVDLHKWV